MPPRFLRTRSCGRPFTQNQTAGTLWPRAITISASPSWRYSSSVRACTKSAREVVPGSAVLSLMRILAPGFVDHSARTISRSDPHPTIRTSLRGMIFLQKTTPC
jgi:hypothetical protein